MSSHMDEMRERLERGESFADIAYGQGWEERFPNFKVVSQIAGGASSSSNSETKEHWFGVSVSTGNGFQSIETEILSFRTESATEQEALGKFDEVCRHWLEGGGIERAQELKQDGTDNPAWKEDYPELASW